MNTTNVTNPICNNMLEKKEKNTDEIENKINNVIKNLNIYKCKYSKCNSCNYKDKIIQKLEKELTKYCSYCVYCDIWVSKGKIKEHNNSDEHENNFYECYN